MKKFKKIFLFIISFLLMFSLVILQFSIFIRFRLLNENFYVSTLEKNNYYKYLNENINTNFKTLSALSAIPESVFKDSISEQLIKTETTNNIKNAINFMVLKKDTTNNGIDLTEFEKNLSNNILNYAKANNIEINNNIQTQVKTVSTDTTNILNNHVNIFNINQVKKINQFIKFRDILNIIYNSVHWFLLMSIFLIGIIVTLNRRAPWRDLFWIGSSLISSGALILLPGILGFLFKVPYRLAIDISYIKEALKDFLSGYFYFSISSGLIMITLGILMLFVYFNISMKKRLNIKET
ncbi:hypothetical protein SAMN02745163_04428 [Clostridium cavendishii DSM 21758]|uniref:Uncharacterized protein n=1 Tax=Clostridium cavendishii DSM 21758 TaxID=1121302 RepID=A0A1M6V6E8_9CLOT|nr:hypothetical protein [Clostridium cavendishii]SHK76906.1 hypothetical protein SAMN02745163_04428 [Clostridium cavendishii DSM 21758]